jgi:hypothetical protein
MRWFMERTALVVLAGALVGAQPFLLPATRAQDKDKSAGQKATEPRDSAEKYAAHGEKEGISIGAEMLTRKQVAKEFTADVNHCCLVVEVAVYPKKDEALELSADDFSLYVEGNDVPVKPEGAAALAAKLEKKNDSGPGSGAGVTTESSVGIGYESGTIIDPVTGQPERVHGVTTSASVGVGIGGGNGGGPAPAGGHDRDTIARELGEKGLPEVKITVPVAGYLYFPVSKVKKDAKFSLEYSLKSGTLVLQLP